MIRRSVNCIALITVLMGAAVVQPQLAARSSTTAVREGHSTTHEGFRSDKQTHDAPVIHVMWREPADLETRDLYFGIGGKNGEPDLTNTFRLLGKDNSGHAKKIKVEDSKHHRWTVKFGDEPRPETVASRIVWAVGYHTDQDYFVDQANVEGHGPVRDVRFERDNDGYKKVGRWDWDKNPFEGSREFDGLKVLMALLNNYDLKTENNKIVSPKKKNTGESGERDIHIYYVGDLGATFGSTGKWFGSLPVFGELPTGTKGTARDYSEQQFITGVNGGIVAFRMKRTRALRAIDGVRVENARWVGNLLGRLSDRQLEDAFRAGHYSEQETQLYVQSVRRRISELQALK